jgi:hypothetical protein
MDEKTKQLIEEGRISLVGKVLRWRDGEPYFPFEDEEDESEEEEEEE